METPRTAQAQQQAGGSVCVLAYEDTNRNGTRDPGEALLADVSVDLMVNEKVVIANYVTDGKETHCFDNLPPQPYTVSFSSPLAQPTTLTSFTFDLGAGERAQREFGAVRAAATDAAPPGSTVNVRATTPVRIGLSALGAVAVMVFIAAVGMIIYGLFFHKR